MDSGGNESLDKEISRLQQRHWNYRNATRSRRSRLNKIAAFCFPKNRNRYCHLSRSIEEALLLARKTRPMFILRESKIPDAGMGVFVSERYPQAPADTVLPYPGVICSEKSSHGRQQKFEVSLPGGRVLRASSKYTPGQPLGCFVNRVMSAAIWEGFQVSSCIPKESPEYQNLSVSNAQLIVFNDCCYLKLDRIVRAGQEILTTYGPCFHI